MNILSKIIIATSLVLATTQAASACSVNYREFHQSGRIIKGAVHGSLTYRELNRLAAGQARVRLMERVARADGYISPVECQMLNTALNTQSLRIWLKKHN